MKKSVIFVVDKNPIHRNLIRYNLESNKCTNVQTFPSGEECMFRLLKKIRPAFLITSFFTGQLTGFEFLHSVLEISPATRVIFFDTFEEPALAAALLKAGACDYVEKTRDPDTGIAELLKKVRYLARENVLIDGP